LLKLARRACQFASVSIIAGGAILISAPPARSFPWDIDMFRGAAVQALAVAPREMPSGTLPIHGEPPISREMATIKLKNPLQPTPGNIAQGKQLFDTFCIACHGADARGDGTVAKVGILSRQPANLVTGVSKDLPEGYIYGTILDGGIVMPSLGDAMSAHQRWQVVLYVRSLQKAAEHKGGSQAAR
jgi:cytochrome c553